MPTLLKQIHINAWAYCSSPSWHANFVHLNQKGISKINRLRSFVISVPRNTLLVNYKTNISPIFSCGSITLYSCSGDVQRMLSEAQLLSAAKIVLGCLQNYIL